METIGDRLRIARRRLGMSQEELGAAAGLSQPAVSRLEYGGGPPPPETLAQLAAALGVELGWLLGTGASEEAAPRRAAHPGEYAPSGTVPQQQAGTMTRLQALVEYRELLDRWRQNEARPGDPRRRRALRVILECNGGVPPELRWRR